MRMRLNKYLASCGVASRRGADSLIEDGRVVVNGKVVKEMGTQIDPENDTVLVVGKKIVPTTEPHTTYILNKPIGVISTASDPEGRPTVMDLVPKSPRVFPCGRLDEDTAGLVILTSDGELCYQLTHPKFEHKKVYLVKGRTKDPASAVANIKRGVRLKDGPVAIDDLKVELIEKNNVIFYLTIHEGRNRLVRRICGAVGIEVDSLTRIKMGDYEMGDLETGRYKQV